MDTTTTTEQSPVISVTGRFDAYSTPEIAGQFTELADQGVNEIWVDLSGTEFIDSTALAELVKQMKRARANGGDLVLWRPSDPVRVILELTSLDLAFSLSNAESLPDRLGGDRRS